MKNRFNNHREKQRNSTEILINDIKNILNNNIKTIFDIGANKGQSAILFAKNFPDANIYSFEPCVETYNILKEKVSNNNLIKTFNIAISNLDGTSIFYINKKKALNSLFKSSHETKYWCNKDNDYKCIQEIYVICKKIDTVIHELNINHIDILKLDIQGGEFSALKGAQESLKKQRLSLILTEINFIPLYENNSNFEDIIIYLRNFGYTLYDFYNLYNAYNGQLKYADVIFISKKIREKILISQIS